MASEQRIETKLEAERPQETTGIIQARNDSGLDQVGRSRTGETYLDPGYIAKVEPNFFMS